MQVASVSGSIRRAVSPRAARSRSAGTSARARAERLAIADVGERRGGCVHLTVSGTRTISA